MRWRLLVITSFAAAFIAFCLWEVLLAVIFGSVRPVQRHDWLLLGSVLVPLAFATAAGMFVYRHTARRRKTQATIIVVLTIFLFIGTYFAGSRLWPHLIGIPRPCEAQPCR